MCYKTFLFVLKIWKVKKYFHAEFYSKSFIKTISHKLLIKSVHKNSFSSHLCYRQLLFICFIIFVFITNYCSQCWKARDIMTKKRNLMQLHIFFLKSNKSCIVNLFYDLYNLKKPHLKVLYCIYFHILNYSLLKTFIFYYINAYSIFFIFVLCKQWFDYFRHRNFYNFITNKYKSFSHSWKKNV